MNSEVAGRYHSKESEVPGSRDASQPRCVYTPIDSRLCSLHLGESQVWHKPRPNREGQGGPEIQLSALPCGL